MAWGHCKNCRHFGSPAAQPLGAEEARCRQPILTRFELRVYGSNGCNAYETRATAREGSTEVLESPQPQA